MNQQELATKLSTIASDLLRTKGYISFVDVFIQLGYLDPADYEKWRRKRAPCLERLIKVNLNKINFIMKTVRKNCRNGGLKESRTDYRSWGKGAKTTLRFSKSGEEAIERTYATHFLKPNGKKKEDGS